MILKTCICLQLFVTAWTATVPTTTVPGIFNLTSLMDMVVNISSPISPSTNMSGSRAEQTCELKEIAECFSATAPRFYTTVIHIYRRDTRMSICSIADDFDACTVPYKPKCTSSDTIAFDIFTGLIQYLCTEQGYDEYLSFVPCISNAEVTSEINTCVDNFPSPLRLGDLCTLPDNYTSCVMQATTGYCDGTSTNMLRQALNTILFPLKIATCQNRSSAGDNAGSSVVVSDSPATVTAGLEIEPSLSLASASVLELADASVGMYTSDVAELTKSQMYEERSSLTYPMRLEEYVTIAPQILQEESVTIDPQILLEESVTVAPQILQEESVTLAPQILQEESMRISPQILLDESVTTASQILLDESVTITPQILQEESVTLAPQILQEESMRIAPQILLDESVTTASQILLDESVTVTPQILQEESVTLAPQILQEESVTVAPRRLQEESVTLTPQILLDESETVAPQRLQEESVTLTPQILLDESVTVAPQILQEESVTVAPQRLQEESVTLAPQILQGESVTVAPQILLDESVTIAPQILQEESVAIRSQLPSQEFSTIKSDVTTPLMYELSTAEIEIKARQQDSYTLAPGVVKSQMFSEGSSKVVLDIYPSSLEISTTLSYITPHLSLRDVAVRTTDASALIESTEAVTADVTEVTSKGIFIQPTIAEMRHKSSGEHETSTRTTDEEKTGVLSKIVTDSVTTTLSSHELPTIVLADSATTTSSLESSTDAGKAASREFATASFDAANTMTSLQQFLTVAPEIQTSEMSKAQIQTQAADVTVTETHAGRFTTSPYIERLGDSSREFLTKSLAVVATHIPSEQFSTVVPHSGTPKVPPLEFSSTFATDIPSDEFSNFAPSTSGTLISAEILPTIAPDVTTVEVSTIATPSIATDVTTSRTETPTVSLVSTTNKAETPIINLYVSTTSTEIKTNGNDDTTISSTKVSTIGEEVSTNIAVKVTTLTQDYTSSADEVSVIVVDGTTIHPSLETLATTAIQDSSTEYTSLFEGFSTATRSIAKSSTSSEASPIATQQIQISPTSVDVLSTATVDVTITQTPPQETTTTAPLTTAPTTATAARSIVTSSTPLKASLITTQLQISPTSVDVLSTATVDVTITQTPPQETTTTAPVTTAPATTTASSRTTTSRDFLTSPLNCYECHSGAPGSWQNVNCPPNGLIQNWAATPNVCHGPCVSRVTKYPAGDVYRACSKNYYFPTPPPRDGCITHNQDLFCFCSTDFCNTRDMIKEQQDYVKGTNTNV